MSRNLTPFYAEITCSDIEYPSWELLGAVANGNLSEVNALIKCDETDVNLVEYWRPDIYGQTSLYIASKKGYVEIVSQLLGCSQIEVNKEQEDGRDKRGSTALVISIEFGHVEVVSLLLGHPHIDVNKASPRSGITPMISALNNGHLEVVNLLLIRPEIDVNLGDSNGDTPLIIASKKGYVEIARLLLAKPTIEVNRANSEDKDTALTMASFWGNSEIVLLLLQHPDTDSTHSDTYGRTALHEAAQRDHLTVVQLLLNNSQIDVNKGTTKSLIVNYGYHRGQTVKQGASPLYMASQNGHARIVQELLGHIELDINKGDINETTALWKASEIGNTDVVKLLLSHHQIDVNKIERLDGRSALFIASQEGNAEVVKLLLDHADINVNIALYNSGVTALWSASANGHLEIVRLLLNTPHIDVFKGKSSDINGYAEVANLIFEKNNMTTNQMLLIAAIIGNISEVEKIIQDISIDVDITDRDGRTALIWAAKNGHSDVVRVLLIQAKIDVNKTNAYGDTALLWASRNGHVQVVVHLIGHSDIDINQVDSGGRTALYKASQSGHFKVVKLLCSHSKILVNKGEPEFGETPLYMAAKNGHFNVVNYFLGISQIDVNKYTIHRETSLMVATSGGYSDIVRIILAFAAVDATFETFERKTTLFYIFDNTYIPERKKMEVLELLLRCPSIDLAHRDLDDYTALDYAKMQNRTDIIKAFEARKSYKKQGHTCCSNEVRKGMQRAAEDGDLTMVKAFLLCPGIDLNNGYEYGRTPLFMASSNNHSDAVKMLLNDSRIDVNVVVNSGNALYAASERSHANIVRLLLIHPDIDVNKFNRRNGKTALIIAAEQGHVEVVKLLLRHPQIQTNEVDFYLNSAIEKAISRAYLRVVKLLLRCPETSKVTHTEQSSQNGGKLIEIHEAVNMLPTLLQMNGTCCLNVKEDLFLGASDGDHRAVRGLLHCPNSNVNAVNIKTRTPLYLAALKGHVEPLKELLSSPFIDVNKGMTKDGSSAFSIASEKGHFEIMSVLLQNNKNVDVSKGWERDAWASKSLAQKIKNAPTATLPSTNTASGDGDLHSVFT